ncbi:hypothetical protein [Streptomyces xinghaiensis]|uniref:hypothetical protein n=1 Tax=Streptomyces xinghaiensis TaxID=1038928 RepID=UPI0002FB06D9|nr:hypothetical protein [Streptomyces sp. SID5475]
MSDAWVWEYDPDAEHVVGGLPAHVVTEVERLARELAVLGRDAGEVGEGGALRTLDFLGAGLLCFCRCRVGR